MVGLPQVVLFRQLQGFAGELFEEILQQVGVFRQQRAQKLGAVEVSFPDALGGGLLIVAQLLTQLQGKPGALILLRLYNTS